MTKPTPLRPTTLASLRDIQTRWDARHRSNREFWLKLGELWYQVCDDPDVERGDLKKLAPFFNVNVDHLARCRNLWAIRDDLPAVDAWVAANHIENHAPGTVFGEQALHRRWKVRSHSESNRLAQTVRLDRTTDGPQTTIIHGDVRERLLGLEDASIDCVVTSPPYHGMADYATEGAIGLGSVADYLRDLVDVFDQVFRVLRLDGTVWLNLDDRWATDSRKAGQKATLWNVRDMPALAKDEVQRGNLLLIPERLIIALQRKGWTIRSRILWHKTVGVRESIKSRPVHSYEFIYMLVKSHKYTYNEEHKIPTVHGRSIIPRHRALGAEPHEVVSKAISDVWYIPPEGMDGHPTVFPRALVERCLSLGCRPGGRVLDPFLGSGTTGVVAKKLGMSFVGIDLNKDYCELALRRINDAPEDDAAEAAD